MSLTDNGMNLSFFIILIPYYFDQTPNICYETISTNYILIIIYLHEKLRYYCGIKLIIIYLLMFDNYL